MSSLKCFVVRYRCRNCEKEFNESYEKGDRITNGWSRVHLESGKCEGNVACKHCRQIKCPQCESDKDIRIMERRAL